MEKVTLTDLRVYLIKNGWKITKRYLERKRKNESYSTRSIKRMVDSSSNRFKCSLYVC